MKKSAIAAIAFAAICHSSAVARAADVTPQPTHLTLAIAPAASPTRPANAAPVIPAAFLMPRLALANEANGGQSPAAPVAAPRKANKEQHLTESWWFWGAVAGVVVTTVAIVIIAGRPLEKPESDLGDMRAF